MSAQHPNILYVGDLEQGRALLAAVEPADWYVYLPADTNEALAMYITYMPDITVIDTAARPALAAEVYFHLRSVDAGPVILLADGAYPQFAGQNAVVLPHTVTRDGLIAAVEGILQQDIQPA